MLLSIARARFGLFATLISEKFHDSCARRFPIYTGSNNILKHSFVTKIFSDLFFIKVHLFLYYLHIILCSRYWILLRPVYNVYVLRKLRDVFPLKSDKRNNTRAKITEMLIEEYIKCDFIYPRKIWSKKYLLTLHWVLTNNITAL